MVERPAKPAAIPITPSGPAPLVTISDDSARVTAALPQGDRVEVLLTGATILSWKTASGRENLWLSDKAVLDGSKGVRGGVPIVFPLFGPPSAAGHAPTAKLGQHGFARAARWEFLGKSSSESAAAGAAGDAAVTLDFGLSEKMLDAQTRQAWPHAFGLTYSITLAPGELGTSLQVQNTGEAPWEFQALLHTYFAVDDISKVEVTGLEDNAYLDKTQLQADGKPTPAAATNQPASVSGETDRIYSSPDPPAAELAAQTADKPGGAPALPPLKPITISEGGKARYEVRREGLRDCVLWNPAEAKAGTMADFGPPDGWRRMVCVEAGAVRAWTKVEGGEAWEGRTTVRAL